MWSNLGVFSKLIYCNRHHRTFTEQMQRSYKLNQTQPFYIFKLPPLFLRIFFVTIVPHKGKRNTKCNALVDLIFNSLGTKNPYQGKPCVEWLFKENNEKVEIRSECDKKEYTLVWNQCRVTLGRSVAEAIGSSSKSGSHDLNVVMTNTHFC